VNRRKFLKVTGVSGIGLQISKQLLGLERSNSLADEEIVYLTDLDRCLPVSGLSKSAKTGSWRMLDYETETLTGTMLVALEESNAPDLTYPLNRTGWYQIYLGIYRKPFESPKQVQLKLTSDPAYTDLEGKSGDTDHRENWIDDVYWKTEDLTKKICVSDRLGFQE